MSQNQIQEPESWVDEHGESLFRYALFRLHDAELAEDLVQETFLAALKGRDRFEGRSSMRTWLFGILKHKIIDQIRKANRERPVEDIEAFASSKGESFDEKGGWKSRPAAWTTDPGALFEQMEFWEVLQRCLSELPSRLNQAFTLRELDGLSAEEVRKILNVSATNGGVMLHRARLRLRSCLEKTWFESKDGKKQ